MTPLPPLNQLSIAPIFNTKAVAHETGVPADTFRAWERRYGVPLPQRTAGGHRLYSERDIAVIRWLRDRTAEGMNISHAVMLLASAPPAMPPDGSARAPSRLIGELVDALTSYDAALAERLVSEAFALYPFEDVMLDMIQPAMVEIGERWHSGEITVAAEHFATQFVRRKLSALLNIFENGRSHATILVGCAPNELHDLGTLIISLFLMRQGWHVIYLGPQMPLADLLAAVRTLKPELVCLSATTVEAAAQLAGVALALQETFPHVLFGYGGRTFNIHPELRDSMPGYFLGPDARTLVEHVRSILARGSTSTAQD